MKTSASLLLAVGTFGAGLLAGRLLFRDDAICKVEAPAVRAEPARAAAPEPPPELERPDSRLVIVPNAPRETEPAAPDHRPPASEAVLASSSQDPARTEQLKQFTEKLKKFLEAQAARQSSAAPR
jgi:hypothetical protein